MYDHIVSRLSNAIFQKVPLETWEALSQLRREIVDIRHNGIVFAIAGNAGVGKTSTVNSLFGLQLPVGHVERGTDTPYKVLVQIENVVDPKQRILDEVTLSIYDLPGLWDEEHNRQQHLYEHLLPEVDVILWIVRADNRARKPDNVEISRLVKAYPEIRERIVIGINYADQVPLPEGTAGWYEGLNTPSREQERALEETVAKVYEDICKTSNIAKERIAYYSAKKDWNLPVLFSLLTAACPNGKKWVFANLKPDFLDAYLSHVSPQDQELAKSLYQSLILSQVK